MAVMGGVLPMRVKLRLVPRSAWNAARALCAQDAERLGGVPTLSVGTSIFMGQATIVARHSGDAQLEIAT